MGPTIGTGRRACLFNRLSYRLPINADRNSSTPLSRSYQVTLVLERDGTPDNQVVHPD